MKREKRKDGLKGKKSSDSVSENLQDNIRLRFLNKNIYSTVSNAPNLQDPEGLGRVRRDSLFLLREELLQRSLSDDNLLRPCSGSSHSYPCFVERRKAIYSLFISLFI